MGCSFRVFCAVLPKLSDIPQNQNLNLSPKLQNALQKKGKLRADPYNSAHRAFRMKSSSAMRRGASSQSTSDTGTVGLGLQGVKELLLGGECLGVWCWSGTQKHRKHNAFLWGGISFIRWLTSRGQSGICLGAFLGRVRGLRCKPSGHKPQFGSLTPRP